MKITKIHFFVILFSAITGILIYLNSIYNFKTFIFIILNCVIIYLLNLKIKIKFFKKVLITYLLFLFSIYTLETLIYLKNQYSENSVFNNKIKVAKEKNLDFDKRSIFQYVYENKKLGKNFFPVIFPRYFAENPLIIDNKKVIPLSSISNAATVYCNESGFYSTYKSDNFGFNNYNDIWKKNKISHNILLIGDSYVHGACVNQNFTITSFLNKKNKNYNFFNLGMGGNGPLINYATLREYGEFLKPKKIFFFFFEGNDYKDLERELSSNLLRKYLEVEFTQNLLIENDKIDTAKKKYYYKFLSSYEPRNFIGEIIRLKNLRHRISVLKKKIKTSEIKIIRSKEQNNESSKDIYVAKDKKNLNDELYTIFINSKKIVESWGGELTVFILPDYGFFHEKKAGKPIKRKKYTKIFEILKKTNIDFIDFYKYLEDNEDVISYFPLELPGHYNEKGYEFIAEVINKNLK